jgi:hypothetical protein
MATLLRSSPADYFAKHPRMPPSDHPRSSEHNPSLLKAFPPPLYMHVSPIGRRQGQPAAAFEARVPSLPPIAAALVVAGAPSRAWSAGAHPSPGPEA